MDGNGLDENQTYVKMRCETQQLQNNSTESNEMDEDDDIEIKSVLVQTSFEQDDINIQSDDIHNTSLEIKTVAVCGSNRFSLSDSLHEEDAEIKIIINRESLPPNDIDDDESNVEIKQVLVNVPLNVENCLSYKESRKLLSSLTARICAFVHNSDLKGLSNYDTYIQERNPTKYKGKLVHILCQIHKIDGLFAIKEFSKAAKLSSKVASNLQNYEGPHTDHLLIRYQTSDALRLYHSNQKELARNLIRSAMANSHVDKADPANGYVLWAYATIFYLDRDNTEQVLLGPGDEDPATKNRNAAAHLLRKCSESNQRWTEDLYEDHKLDEATVKYFWLWPNLNYVFTILDSSGDLAIPTITEEDLIEAGHFLRKLETNWNVLSTRMKFNWQMAKCDWNIRASQILTCGTYIDEAWKWLKNCDVMLTKYPLLRCRGERHRVDVRRVALGLLPSSE